MITNEDVTLMQGLAYDALCAGKEDESNEPAGAFTRSLLVERCAKDISELLELMRRKNQHYGTTEDAFYNFRETARRTICANPSYEDMLKVLVTLADKHWVAICQNGLADPAVEERFGDMIVYCLIARQMIRAARRSP